MARKPPLLIPTGKRGQFFVRGTAPNEGPNVGRPITGMNQKTARPIYGPRPKRLNRTRRAILGQHLTNTRLPGDGAGYLPGPSKPASRKLTPMPLQKVPRGTRRPGTSPLPKPGGRVRKGIPY